MQGTVKMILVQTASILLAGLVVAGGLTVWESIREGSLVEALGGATASDLSAVRQDVAQVRQDVGRVQQNVGRVQQDVDELTSMFDALDDTINKLLLSVVYGPPLADTRQHDAGGRIMPDEPTR